MFARLFALLTCAALIGACGASSSLDDFSDRRRVSDAGVDGDLPDGDLPDGDLPDGDRPDVDPPDVGPDMPDMGGITVECSPPQMARPGERVDVRAEVVSPTRVRGDWFADGPGMFSLDGDITSPTIGFTGFDAGGYTLVYTVTDALGNSGSCETFVAVVNGPPIASCPGDEQVGPEGEPLIIRGAGFDDDGIVRYQWDLIEGELEILEPNSPVTPVIGFVGTHRMRLTVEDTDGDVDQCVVTVRFTAPPVLACPSGIRVPSRSPVNLVVEGTDDTAIVRHDWSFREFPPDAMPTFDRVAGNRATFTPQRRGRYTALYTATDTDGLSSSCLLVVEALDTPPTLTCPEEIRATPMRPFTAEVGVIDDGTVESFRWVLSLDETGVDRAMTTVPSAMLTPLIAGRHVLDVTATDDGGFTASCEIDVLVVSDDGLRVEVLWDTDRTDMDTHLLNPTATRWFNDDDCHFSNCRGGLSWEPPGTENDPFLDLDDTNGFGPENINIETAAPGVYRVGVDAYSGNATVTVRIYCGGSRVDPVLELEASITRGQFWRVADVDIRSAIECTVTPLLNAGGGPNISTDSDAMTRR